MTTLAELSFSREEYRSRVTRVKDIIAEKNLDALLCHTFTNICYLTGLETICSYVYFMLVVPREGDCVLLGRDFEMHNSLVSAWTQDNVTFGIRDDPIEASRALLVDRGLADKRLGVEQDSFSLSRNTLVRLEKALPEATWVDAGGTVERVKGH